MSPGTAPEGPASGPAQGREPAPGSEPGPGSEPAPGSERAEREGVAATTEGAAALVPGGRPEERPAADGAEPPTRLERRLRLQGLAGMTVLGSDGKTVGRVRDIYQQDASGELAAITVMPRQLSAHTVLIPSAAIAALPAEQPEEPSDAPADGQADDEDETADPHPAEAVRLRIGTAVARAGMRPPQTGHATPEELREAEAALGLPTSPAQGCAQGRAEGPGEA